MRYVIAALVAFLSVLPANAGEPDMAVGECRHTSPSELLCRGGADWYVIVPLEHSVIVAVASD